MGKPAETVGNDHLFRKPAEPRQDYRDTAESGETYDVEIGEEESGVPNDPNEDKAREFLKEQREKGIRIISKENR